MENWFNINLVIMSTQNQPVFLGSSHDGEKFLIDGVNVWSYNWIDHDRIVEVQDPYYPTKHRFRVYSILAEGREIHFIAGEPSDFIWAFYRY
jgi:hypothetical protein